MLIGGDGHKITTFNYFNDMCKKNNPRHSNDYQENRYSDGKHFSKKNKNADKKSRNNVKTNLRKEYLW
jgi:hypothetical protein